METNSRGEGDMVRGEKNNKSAELATLAVAGSSETRQPHYTELSDTQYLLHKKNGLHHFCISPWPCSHFIL